MGLYLLTGTPGQAKGDAANKIREFLRARNVRVGFASVEDELLTFFPQYTGAETSNKEPRVSLISQRAQDEIKDKWPEAFNQAVEKATSNSDVAIVSTCFEYYRSETYEFYSPVNCDIVSASKPQCVLTLIDDVYDTYYRLSQPGQVFEIQELIERSFSKNGTTSGAARDLRQQYKDALGVVVGSLLRVLAWREKEVQCAADICRTIGCECNVLASKHPVETGVRLLLGTSSADIVKLGTSYAVYISHPISRPRRDRSTQEKWPEFVNHLEEMVASLSFTTDSPPQILPVMPTAIDEFRIFDDGKYLHPHLTPRWPLHGGNLLYSLPKASQNMKDFTDYSDFAIRGLPQIFNPPIDSSGKRAGLPLSDLEVSGMLRTLRESIRLQMAARDHLLVRQCPGLFLYRPLYDEFEFTGGVLSEIHTFHQIRKYSPEISGKRMRYVSFIHDTNDAKGAFSKKEDENGFPDTIHRASSALTAKACDLVHKSTHKSKLPASPDNKTVAKALQNMEDLEGDFKDIHTDMFPSVKPGTIGNEQPLDWDETKDMLKHTVKSERTQALSSDISENVVYKYFDANQKIISEWNSSKDADTYVEVVDDLDANSEQRKNTAIRTRQFFARGCSE